MKKDFAESVSKRIIKSFGLVFSDIGTSRICEIRKKAIFFGIEDIVINNPVWRVFSIIMKLTPNFVRFHKLPSNKLPDTVTRVEI